MENDFNKWLDCWDNAQKENIFPVEKRHIPSSQTVDPDFFGLQSTAQTDDVSDADSNYWNQIHDRANEIDGVDNVLNETERPDYEIVNPDKVVKRDRKEMAQTLGKVPNPVYPNTTGKDQGGDSESFDKSLDATFAPRDLEDLADMKIRLHQLENKLNSFESRGENSKKYETQISELKKKIDDLSDSFGVAYKEWGLV